MGRRDVPVSLWTGQTAAAEPGGHFRARVNPIVDTFSRTGRGTAGTSSSSGGGGGREATASKQQKAEAEMQASRDRCRALAEEVDQIFRRGAEQQQQQRRTRRDPKKP